jgi:aminopeptidase N
VVHPARWRRLTLAFRAARRPSPDAACSLPPGNAGIEFGAAVVDTRHSSRGVSAARSSAREEEGPSMHRRSLLAVALVVMALASAPSAAGVTFSPGSAGLGDVMYPLAGNGGYDVSHYSLDLDYVPATNTLTGTVTIDARATQNLSRFDLDLRGFTITRLVVNRATAFYRRDGQELIITPRIGIPKGADFSVTVSYTGVPEIVKDPDDSIEGWIPTDDGAFVVNEPQGSPGWYPVNDNPRDKATFDFRVRVPAGLTVMANGVLVSHDTANGRTTWVWRETDPMAPYLATTTLGKFDLTITKTSTGIPSYVAIDPQLAKGQVLTKLPEAFDFYSSIYGPYPFTATGAILDRASFVGYSLETQTKPNFPYVPSEATLVHELSHMWYGDSVTLKTWPDIWLHEGFATWSEWIWSERHGNKSAAQWFQQLYNTPASNTGFWGPAVADFTDPALLFNGTVYYRGAMTLQALRQKLGDATFFRIMRNWVQQNKYGTVTTPQFIAFAEKESGRDLTNFFDVWIYQDAKPAPGSW